MIDRRSVVSGAASVVGLSGAQGLTATVLKAAANRAQGRATLAVAASLRFVFEDAVSAWQASGKTTSANDIRLVFGATSTLTHQIENGAPFDALFAADTQSPLRLSQAKLTAHQPRVFARGQLALVSVKSSGLTVDANFTGLKTALGSGKLRRLALANPELAPYGLAAMQALQKAGLAGTVADSLVYGENVGQAAQFALSGAAQAGLIALSLARTEVASARLNVAVVDQSWHDPIEHVMARLHTKSTLADQFCSFVGSNEMAEILLKHGFIAIAEQH